MIPAGSDTWISYVYLLDFSFREVACVYFVTMATNTVETTTFCSTRIVSLYYTFYRLRLDTLTKNNEFNDEFKSIN